MYKLILRSIMVRRTLQIIHHVIESFFQFVCGLRVHRGKVEYVGVAGRGCTCIILPISQIALNQQSSPFLLVSFSRGSIYRIGSSISCNPHLGMYIYMYLDICNIIISVLMAWNICKYVCI